jgi:glycosyltransferase involved in cell wall biosynthesis
MKVSLITTVLDEEKTIEEFVDSIISQTKRPDELVIVDGGSKDRTYEILKKYRKRYKWIKLFQLDGASIGRGRNEAIKRAKNEIVAVTDAGCVLDKNWLKEITAPFLKKDIDIVVGIYKPYSLTDFEYFQGLMVVPDEEKIFMNPSRMSSRSLAFRKDVWEDVSGYPDLSTGEDTNFNLKLIEGDYGFAFAKEAVVYWRMRKNWKGFARQFYKYGVGDVKSGNIWKVKKNLALVVGFWLYLSILLLSFGRPAFYFLFIPALLYLGVESVKILIKGEKKMSGPLYVPLLILIKRVAYVLGVSIGK